MSFSTNSRTSAWITCPGWNGATGAPNALGSVSPGGRWIASTGHSLRWTLRKVYGARMKRSLTLRKPYLSREGQHGPGCLHVGEARRAALQCELVATPELHVPVFVDMRCGPGLLDCELACRHAKRDQRRAGERGDQMHGAEPPRVRRNGRANRRNRPLRLR